MNACPFPGENKKDRIQGIRPGSFRCRHPLSFCLRDRHVYIHGLHLRPSIRSLSRDMRVHSPLREQRRYYSTGPSFKTIAVSQEIHVKYRAKYRRNTERPGKNPGRAPWRRHHEGRTAYKEGSGMVPERRQTQGGPCVCLHVPDPFSGYLILPFSLPLPGPFRSPP